VTCTAWTDPALLGMPGIQGTVLRIERFAIHDGPGIRTTVFMKGCPLRCAWCHSPESQLLQPEFMPRPDRCVHCLACANACPFHAAMPADAGGPPAPKECTTCGACAEACPTGARELVGRTMSTDALMAEIERDRIFYDESGGGVTFSGGEPLMQPVFLANMVRSCRASGIHVAIDTCGHVDTRALLDVARDTDLFLFDLKLMDDERHREYTGASNVRILRNLERLTSVHGNVRVRFPLIPGVNDDDENVRAMGALLASLGLTRIDVLPYHRAGLTKYDRLQRPCRLSDTRPPTADRQTHVVRLLESCGLIVQPGGSS
jgi:pyruvate formate lyase activating enzyme